MKWNKFLAIVLCLLLVAASFPINHLVAGEPQNLMDEINTASGAFVAQLHTEYREQGLKECLSYSDFDLEAVAVLARSGVPVGAWISDAGETLTDAVYGLEPGTPKDMAAQYRALVFMDALPETRQKLAGDLWELFDAHEGRFYPEAANSYYGDFNVLGLLSATGWLDDITEEQAKSLASYILKFMDETGMVPVSWGSGVDIQMTVEGWMALSDLAGSVTDPVVTSAIEQKKTSLLPAIETGLQEDGSILWSWIKVLDTGMYLSLLEELGLTSAEIRSRVLEEVSTQEGLNPLTFLVGGELDENIPAMAWALRGLLAAGADLSASVFENKAEVSLRIEGPQYTIEPGRILSIDPGMSYLEVLQVWADETGKTFESPEEFVVSIDGMEGDPYWMVDPLQVNGYLAGDALVFSGNGSTASGRMETSAHTVKPGQNVTLTVRYIDGEPVDGATVIWYPQGQGHMPRMADGLTDNEGKMALSFSETGTFYLAADRKVLWGAHQGLIRTEPIQILVQEQSSGGGSTSPITVDVSLRVTRPDGNNLYNGTVRVMESDSFGPTPLGALLKSGLTVSRSGNFVNGIEGYQNEGMSGWMYAVNGFTPAVASDRFELRSGDVVRWYYGDADDADPNVSGVYTEAQEQNSKLEDLEEARQNGLQWIMTHRDFTVYDDFGDWDALALVRSGGTVPATYLESLVEHVQSVDGKFRLVTDTARLIQVLSAIGEDPRQVTGYDLVSTMLRHDGVMRQGVNGPVHVLLALDSGGYGVLRDGQWTRQRLVLEIGRLQKSHGGFSLSSDPQAPGNIDLTAMVLQALGPYRNSPEAAGIISDALDWLRAQTFVDSEGLSQTILALSALGLDPMTEAFSKVPTGLPAELLSYQTTDGGFVHVRGAVSDPLATQQAVLALAELMETGRKAPQGVLMTDEQEVSGWAFSWVQRAILDGLMSGVSVDEVRFEPARTITRAETAVLMVNLMGLEPELQGVSVYGDVRPDSWYSGYAMRARQEGWMSGTGPETFSPQEPITRQELAVVLMKIMGERSWDAEVMPDDIFMASPWASEAVKAAFANGWMVGDGSRFLPREPLTREMAAVILLKIQEFSLGK